MTAPSRSFHSITSAQQDDGTGARCLSPRFLSGQKSEVFAIDIWKIAKEFPERWSRLMHDCYRADIPLIIATFNVSERTARKWVKGEGGVNSRHSTIAQLEHPKAYSAIILDRAA